MKWRPVDWTNPYSTEGPSLNLMRHDAFEAGADAILAALELQVTSEIDSQGDLKFSLEGGKLKLKKDNCRLIIVPEDISGNS